MSCRAGAAGFSALCPVWEHGLAAHTVGDIEDGGLLLKSQFRRPQLLTLSGSQAPGRTEGPPRWCAGSGGQLAPVPSQPLWARGSLGADRV